MNWVKELKVGDKVLQIENHKKIPNGFWKWKGIVSQITNAYIEVKFNREPMIWLEEARIEMKKKSQVNIDKTYNDIWVKNYFSPDGTINISKWE